MRVAVSPIDRAGVGSYRAIWPAETARAAGVDVVVVEPDALTSPADLFDFDVVVVQIPLHVAKVAAIEVLQRRGVAVVVEVDDDYATIHPGNRAYWRTRPDVSPESNHELLAVACQRADLVTVTTPRLRDVYGVHGRCHVVPNCVPDRYLDITGDRTPVRVGWAGLVANHPTDLRVVGDGIRRALAASGAHLHVVGIADAVAEQLDVDAVTATGVVPIADYPIHVAGLDVGLVPLAPSVFNQSKSWLKGLEYAALGVPFVASPTVEYSRLHRLGAGLLAADPSSWADQVTTLAASAEARAELAGAGRAVAAGWTFTAQVHRWVEAWAAAMLARRRTLVVR